MRERPPKGGGMAPEQVLVLVRVRVLVLVLVLVLAPVLGQEPLETAKAL